MSDQNCKIQKVPGALFEDIFSAFFGLLNKIRADFMIRGVWPKTDDRLDLQANMVFYIFI